jgi:DNA-binding response OmpR family regulator
MSRIVIVEDDGALRSDLIDHLRDWGHKVTGTGEAQIGAELVESWRPEILVCDVQLPDGNGFQLAQWVRERHPDTVIIFMSALTASKELLLGGVYGDDYLSKPIDYEQLAKKIDFHHVQRGGVVSRVGKWWTGAA